MHNEAISATADYIREQVSAGDSEIDAAYVGGEYINGIISEGLLVDLASVETLQLGGDWWNQNIKEASEIGPNNSVYYALSDLSLTGFDLTWCISFNPEIIEENQLENPYTLVKEGRWTFDKMWEYAKSAANLNGETKYFYETGGQSTFGFTTYNNFVMAALNGAGLSFATRNADGKYEYGMNNEKLLNFCDDYGDVAGTLGVFLTLNTENHRGEQGCYDDVFLEGRALFAGVEVKATGKFKKMEDYGILPVPKADEGDTPYYCSTNYLTPLLCIPISNIELEKTGIVLDAMSYISYKDILPVYYDQTLSNKNLKSPDAVEMLNIIRDSRVFEISLLYGWSNKLYEEIRNKLDVGDGWVSSTLSSYDGVVNANINKTYDFLG